MKYLQNLSIMIKFQLISLGFVFVTAAVIGVLIDSRITSNISNIALSKLDGFASQRALLYEAYLDEITGNVEVFVQQTPRNIASLKDFSFAFELIDGDFGEIVRKIYIDDNPNPKSQRQLLTEAASGSEHEYTFYHTLHHPRLIGFLESGFDDVLFIDPNGNVLYSVRKDDDFGINLRNNPVFQDSALGRVFERALETDDVVFEDFSFYPDNDSNPAAFLAMAMRDISDDDDGIGELLGVVAVRVPYQQFSNVITNTEGLDEETEMFLLNIDYFFITDSRFTDEDIVLKHQVIPSKKVQADIETILMAKRSTSSAPLDIEGLSGIERLISHTGKESFSTTRYIDFLDTIHILIAESTTREVFQPVRNLERLMILVVGLIMIVMFFLTLFASRTITLPIRNLTDAMKRLASGKTDIDLDSYSQGNEIGDMVAAVGIFRENMFTTQKFEKERADLSQMEKERIQQFEALSESFNSRVVTLLDEVSSAMQEMEDSNIIVLNAVGEAHKYSAEISDATENATDKVQNVASATAQMASSVNEITLSMQKSITAINNTRQTILETDEVVKNMSDLSSQIGEIVSLITDIAAQTNLLALNATIEAARAGEAGKGFAVVANEVKNLANQTTSATDDIAAQINNIQTISKNAADAIVTIQDEIQLVDDMMASVNTAMEEQSVTTQSINETSDSASNDTQSANKRVKQVTERVNDTLKQSENMSESVNKTGQTVTNLQNTIQQFLADLNAIRARGNQKNG